RGWSGGGVGVGGEAGRGGGGKASDRKFPLAMTPTHEVCAPDKRANEVTDSAERVPFSPVGWITGQFPSNLFHLPQRGKRFLQLFRRFLRGCAPTCYPLRLHSRSAGSGCVP